MKIIQNLKFSNLRDLFSYIRSIFYTFLVFFIYFNQLKFKLFKHIESIPKIRGKNGFVYVGKNMVSFGNIKIVFDDKATVGELIIGDNFKTEGNIVISPRGGRIKFGNDCFIGSFCIVQSVNNTIINIGNNVLIASGVNIISSNHNYALGRLIKDQGESGIGINIGSDVWIGANVTILDGSNISDGSIVAAGSVVRGVFGGNSIIGGVPAHLIKYRA